MLKNKLKKYLLLPSSLLIGAAPFLALSFDYEVVKDKNNSKDLNNHSVPSSKMLIYNNRIFKSKDEIIDYYLRLHPNAISNKNVIGNVKKAIIDFDNNVLNSKKLPVFKLDSIHPVYKTASQELTKEFEKAKKSKINPAFTTHNYTDGFDNFFDYKNIAKNSFSKHLVPGTLGVQKINLLDGTPEYYNPLSTNDYNSYFLDATKSLKNYQANKLNLPNHYERQYFNKNNQEIKSINEFFQDPSLTNLFNKETNKEFDHYLQMKNTENVANNYDLVTENKFSNLNNSINIQDYDLQLTSLQNDVLKAKNEHIKELMKNKKQYEDNIRSLSKEILNLEDNVKYYQDRINNNRNKSIDEYDVQNSLDKNDSSFSSGFSKYSYHWIKNYGRILDSGSASHYKARFFSGKNASTKKDWYEQDDYGQGHKAFLENSNYYFYDSLDISNLNDIKIIFNFRDYDWNTQRNKFRDSRIVKFDDYFKFIRKKAEYEKKSFLSNYEIKNNEKIFSNYNFRVFIDSINIGKTAYDTDDDSIWDANDTFTKNVRFRDITFKWHFTLNIESESNADHNKINNLQNQINDKKSKIDNSNNEINNINNEISKNKIYIQKLGDPKPFKEIKDLSNQISGTNVFMSNLNGLINNNEITFSYDKFKKVVENDTPANKNIIKSHIGNDNTLYLWLRNKQDKNKESLYTLNLSKMMKNNIFSLMDSVKEKDNLQLVFDFKNLTINNSVISGIKVYWKLKREYPKFKHSLKPPEKLNFNQIKKLDISKDYLFFKLQDKINGFKNGYENTKRLDNLKTFLNKYNNDVKEVITYNQFPVLSILRNNKTTIKDVVPYSKNKEEYEFRKLLNIFKNSEYLYNQYINHHLEEFKEKLRIASFKDNIKPGFETVAYHYFSTLQNYIKKTSIIGKLPKNQNFKLPEKIENFNLFAKTPIIAKKYWVLNQYIFNGSILSKAGMDRIKPTNIYKVNDVKQEALMQKARKEYTKYFNPPLVSHLYDANGKEVVIDSSGYSMYDSLDIIMENAKLKLVPEQDHNQVFYDNVYDPIDNIVSNIYVLNYGKTNYYFMDYDSLRNFLDNKIMIDVKTYVREDV